MILQLLAWFLIANKQTKVYTSFSPNDVLSLYLSAVCHGEGGGLHDFFICIIFSNLINGFTARWCYWKSNHSVGDKGPTVWFVPMVHWRVSLPLNLYSGHKFVFIEIIVILWQRSLFCSFVISVGGRWANKVWRCCIWIKGLWVCIWRSLWLYELCFALTYF